eukprot:5896734-Pyramimonas_sp.AAC.1
MAAHSKSSSISNPFKLGRHRRLLEACDVELGLVQGLRQDDGHAWSSMSSTASLFAHSDPAP